MKIISVSFILYFLGICVSLYSAVLNMRINYLLKKHISLSDKITIKMAHHCYILQKKFIAVEDNLLTMTTKT